MYNTNYECRYYRDDVFLETDQVNDDEKEYIRNILYKEDLLNIFYITENDDFEVMDHIMSELYKKITGALELRECMRKVASQIISENEELGLCILYSYEFMYLTHKCICSYLETGSISEKDMDNLKSRINNV